MFLTVPRRYPISNQKSGSFDPAENEDFETVAFFRKKIK